MPATRSSASTRAAPVAAGESLPDGYVVAAHGLGATVALGAAPRLGAGRYVVLGPVLDLSTPVSAVHWLAQQPLPEAAHLDLTQPLPWEEVPDLAALMLGPESPARSCLSVDLARDVAGWVMARELPLDLAAVTAPVWIGVAQEDAVAPLENVVARSRLLPSRELLRLGRTRFDARDFDHGALLSHRVPLRLATRAARGER